MYIYTANGYRSMFRPMAATPPLPVKWFTDAMSNLTRNTSMEDTGKKRMLDLWDAGQYGVYATEGRDV